jgi:hypothetical protein
LKINQLKGAQGAKEDVTKLNLKAQNESASKKKKPFEYSEKDTKPQPNSFSLKDLDPEQMRQINQLLKDYI